MLMNPAGIQEPLLFLDVEASSPDEDGYPICIAWSNPEGQIQTALIIPEDDWVDWDFSYRQSHGLTREHLFEQGQSALDVIRQLSADLRDYTVYVDGLDPDTEWLTRLFSSFGLAIPFEIETINRSPLGFRFQQFVSDRDEMLQDHGLSGFNAENNVYVMLRIAERQLAIE